MTFTFRIIFFAITCIEFSTLQAQSWEFLGGVNFNRFYDYQDGEAHYQSDYSTETGISIGLGTDLQIDSFNLGILCFYEWYSGVVEASDGGLGGGYEVNALINKSVISICALPLSFHNKVGLTLDAGVEFSFLMRETSSGTYTFWFLGQPTITQDLNERYDSFSNSFQYGVRLRLSYEIPISPSVILSPQYSFYYGLSNEFKEFPYVSNSMRHYFLIGVGKNI